MKNIRLLWSLSLILIGYDTAIGQVFRGYNPDATIMVGEQLVYQADFSGNPDNPDDYSLLVARPDMIINQTSGLITWTPANVEDGGKVVVKATNSIESATDTILFFVSRNLNCLNGAIAYWNFDTLKSATYYKDYVDAHNAITYDSLPADIIGKVGKAIDVTEVNQGLIVTDHADFHFGSDQSFSIAFWFKTDIGDRDGTGVIIGRDEGNDTEDHHWWIGFDKYNQVNFFVRDAVNYTDTARAYSNKFYNNFNWHQVVCVRNASSDKLKIYCDYDGSTPLTGNAMVNYPGSSESFGSSTAADLNIGFLSNAFQMDGSLDELLIFNRTLSDLEISNLYSKGTGGNPVCDAGNSLPVFTSSPDTMVFEDQPYNYHLVAKDIDVNDNLDYSPVNLPAWMSYEPSTHVLSGTPLNNDVGMKTVKVKVSDGTDEVFQQYNLNVKNVNDPPVISSIPVLLIVNEEQAISYQVDATDVDTNDVIIYSLTQNPAWLSVDPLSGVISGTAPLNDTGSYTITVRVTDMMLAYDEQSFTLDIRDVNDPPVITGQNPNPLTVDEDNSLSISLSDIVYTDADNASGDLTFTVLSGNNYTVADNTITPALNYNGSLTVNIQLSDLLSSASGTVAVAVNPVNDAPVITSTPATAVNEDEQYMYDISFSDVDAGDVVTLSYVTIPDWMNLSVEQATLSGTPTNDQVGMEPSASYAVKLKVSDGNLDSTQTFNITVANINDAPEIIGQKDTLIASPNSSVVLQLSDINVVDVDDPDIDLTLTVLPGTNYAIAGNTVLVNNDASLGYLPVNIRVSDPDNAQDEGIYELRILLTGIEDIQNTSSLVKNVYPTPANEFAVFEFAAANQLTLQVFDMMGKLLTEEHLIYDDHIATINTGLLSNGIYFFRVSTDKLYQTGRFTVIH